MAKLSSTQILGTFTVSDRSKFMDEVEVNGSIQLFGGSTTVGAVEFDDVNKWWLKLMESNIGIYWDSDNSAIDIRNPEGTLTYNNQQIATQSWANSIFLTSYNETDPTVPNHVKSITSGNISTWNSALQQSDLNGYALESWVNTQLNLKQDKLTAGSNITISETTISATDTTYSAGTLAILNTGTDLTNRVWRAKDLADWLNGKNFLTSADITGKADKTINLTAGNGLVGGGNLSANRSFAVDFGTVSGKVVEGNDSRLVESFNKKVNTITVTGDTNKTITLTREDGTTLTASFNDNNDVDPNDDVLNTLSFSSSTGILTAITSEGAEITASLDGRYSLLGHSHIIADITGLQSALNGKENTFSKNTGFNKNFGTTTGTVAQGNDSRIVNGQTAFGWGDHGEVGYLQPSALNGYATQSWVNTKLEAKQDNLIAGANISIVGTTISATNTTYSAGSLAMLNTGTDLTNRVWRAKDLVDWLNGKNYLTDFEETDPTVPNHVKAITTGNINTWNSALQQSDLNGYALESWVNTQLNLKQDKLTAGTNITISGNTISATDTTYSEGSVSLLSTGNDNLNRVWKASDLHTWIYSNFDYYGAWGLLVEGNLELNVGSGQNVNFVGGNNISLQYVGGKVVIHGDVDPYNGLDLQGTTDLGSHTTKTITVGANASNNHTFLSQSELGVRDSTGVNYATIETKGYNFNVQGGAVRLLHPRSMNPASQYFVTSVGGMFADNTGNVNISDIINTEVNSTITIDINICLPFDGATKNYILKGNLNNFCLHVQNGDNGKIFTVHNNTGNVVSIDPSTPPILNKPHTSGIIESEMNTLQAFEWRKFMVSTYGTSVYLLSIGSGSTVFGNYKYYRSPDDSSYTTVSNTYHSILENIYFTKEELSHDKSYKGVLSFIIIANRYYDYGELRLGFSGTSAVWYIPINKIGSGSGNGYVSVRVDYTIDFGKSGTSQYMYLNGLVSYNISTESGNVSTVIPVGSKSINDTYNRNFSVAFKGGVSGNQVYIPTHTMERVK